MKYNLSITRPKNFLHSDGFREVVDSLSWSLVALGHQTTIRENWISNEEDVTNILFGAELLALNNKLPKNTIVYNLEQPSHPKMPEVRMHCQGLRVWDYSAANVKAWELLGYNAKHVPIGYTPNLSRIPAQDPDIDVLFFGWMTPRRQKIVADLRQAGLNVVATDSTYGGGRDNLISRAKVCLNVHHDGRTLFEVVRVSYLLANGKCVVSEVSSDDSEYADLKEAFCRVQYHEIVGKCLSLAKDLDYVSSYPWREIAWNAKDLFSKRDYVQTVKEALVEYTPQERVARSYCQNLIESDMRDFLVWMRKHAKGTILEIGVRHGASTSAFLSGVEENGGVVLSLDKVDCSHLFCGHPQWKFIRTNSQNEKLKVPPLDVLLIDGQHTREAYRADFEKFYPLVKPGGLILSHDINPKAGETLEDYPGSDLPSKAVREEYFRFCEEYGTEHEELPGQHGMGVMTKPLADSDESWQASEALTSSHGVSA